MDSLSSINTNLSPGLIEGFSPKSMQAVPAVQSDSPENQNYYSAGTPDLNNYYNEVTPDDILAKTGQSLVESAKVLDNTMVIALQNGYSVQDVCNIKLAEMAYKANAYIFGVATKISTFELDV